jgi:hypothetical protein
MLAVVEVQLESGSRSICCHLHREKRRSEGVGRLLSPNVLRSIGLIN